MKTGVSLITSLLIVLIIVSTACSTPPAPIYMPIIEETTATATYSTPLTQISPIATGISSTTTPSSSTGKTTIPSTSKTAQPANLYRSKLVEIATSLVNDVLPLTSIQHSDEEAMTLFRDKLINKGIAASLVKINSRLGADGNLNYCIAVNTMDQGIVFLYILPKELDLNDEDYRLQQVYLTSNERVGLLPVKFANLNDYTWYKTYLENLYKNWDYSEYLSEYGDIVDKNKVELETLSSQIDKLIDFAENPNIISYDSGMSQNQIDTKYNSLLDEVQARIDQFNIYNEQCNVQIDEFNASVASDEIESNRYPHELFYIEEYYTNPNNLYPLISIPTPFNYKIITPVPFATARVPYTIDTYLNALQIMVNRDYSFSLLPAPFEKDFKADRVTDKNFVVDDYDIRW